MVLATPRCMDEPFRSKPQIKQIETKHFSIPWDVVYYFVTGNKW